MALEAIEAIGPNSIARRPSIIGFSDSSACRIFQPPYSNRPKQRNDTSRRSNRRVAHQTIICAGQEVGQRVSDSIRSSPWRRCGYADAAKGFIGWIDLLPPFTTILYNEERGDMVR